mmetsp:Transcript_98802/g.288217  ORF Transcript_98802/g.288217 Transcript_98802/m.288217 type:complete len:258 (+) Transcript_98802:1287-2060(+)
MASEAWIWSSRARRSNDSRSSSSRRARACTTLNSSSTRTSCSSALRSRLRTEESSPSAPRSFSLSSPASAAPRRAACASCSAWSRRSASSACTTPLLLRSCEASLPLSLISSCKLVMRMFRSMFSRLTSCSSSSSSTSRLLVGSTTTSSTLTAAGLLASLNCCFSCSNMARWFKSVLRSSISPKDVLSPDGTIDGRALEMGGLVDRRDSSSERSWSRDSVLEALPSWVICLTCSTRRSTCFFEASSSLSMVDTFCFC